MSESTLGGYRSVKLDDVAKEISDRVDTPSESGYDRFVGLEHLDSGELTVRRWGNTAELLSAMKLFKSGDILIGRRNAYLKRASKVEFDGVCSGDAYVVREKPEQIAEGLLPLILNTDSFWDYTIAHASGTMSKRAKWRDLAEYSFLLPPINEQRRIATTLWAVEDCIMKGYQFVTAVERAKQALMRILFHIDVKHKNGNFNIKNFENQNSWRVGTLSDIAEVNPQTDVSHLSDDSIVTFLPMENVGVNGEIVKKEQKKYKDVKNGFTCFQEDDVLFAKITPCMENGKGAKVNKLESNVGFGSTEFIILRAKEGGITDFIFQISRSPKFRLEAKRYMRGSAGQLRVPKDLFYKINIVLPSPAEQKQIAATLTRCDKAMSAGLANVEAMKAMKMKMINEMLTPNIVG